MLKNVNLITLGSKQAVSSTYLLMAGISEEACREAIAWILDANMAPAEERPEVLTLMICSPGGELAPAIALIDVMRGSAVPIQTIGIGEIASAGLLIFMAGDKGKRILTENTSIMSHRYSWGTAGKSHELISAHKEFQQLSMRMMNMYKKFTGLKEKDIEKFLLPPEDVWLTAEEALKYGICDHIRDLK